MLVFVDRKRKYDPHFKFIFQSQQKKIIKLYLDFILMLSFIDKADYLC
jgi:hypothetical protein